ncbi:alcohol dehydrogenase GroES-like domain-containing protein [Colletotrichum paranaense]|uniref:Alcohol dehydrogenase GroES-like domain-containing protein n=1 Tax=Colletotrichum paranaense TaxID=1914294 RepID=A0ABQ9RZE3_9PEZI|nr:alcohol dehydrogenase GroES-like domain-containing protein [Colletotrichum paranaense]KAK1520040.1 alcohol dehydrogenase GroES-like domain-containing protein [Colletotrichum paranaense]
MSTSGTMRAVVFNGPRSVSVEQRPIPTVQDDGDVIVKVQATALCGSELHVFRGHQPSETGFIMGHEFTGTVVEKGAAVTSLNIGDRVVSPFTSSCMNCFYCKNGYTSRCARSKLFGCGALDGGQAEYVRIPDADGTAMKAPTTISDNALVLMADIFPTGFFGAKSGFNLLKEEERSNATAVVIGCGPVGLCAVISALEYRPKHLFAIDSVDSRLELARSLGAEPLNFKTDRAGMEKRIKEVTDGRGADVVIEVVGLSPALRTAFDIIRPFGVIASIGVHNGEIPWTGTEAYGKNLRLQMGRCPVRAIFPEALALLEKKQDKLGFMFDRIMPLSEAVEGYALFDQMKVQKVIFTP